MRIGMVTAVYKPVINGVTQMVALYKEALEVAGHEVTVFTIGNPDPNDEPDVVRSPGLRMSERGYYLTAGYTREAQKLMRQMDVLHCHHLIMSVELAHRYGRSPIIYTNHTRYDLYGNSLFNIPQPAFDAIIRQVWPEFCDYADTVIAPSESVRQLMLDFGVRTPILTVENGVDLAPFHHPSAPFSKGDLGIPETAVLAIYVGRLDPEKNVTQLLEQFAVAADIVPDLHLLMIGDGTNRIELENCAQILQIADRVHFTGVVPTDQVPNYIAAADLFATASVTEVHPLTVIEAMAGGLPVVAVSSPGIVDTVESGQTGLLTTKPEGGLAAAMVGLALNEQQRVLMRAAAHQASAKYDIKRTASITLELYEQLLADRPDLKRKKRHGRRFLYRERVQNQLNRILNLPKEADGPTFNWFGTDFGSPDNDRNHDNWQ